MRRSVLMIFAISIAALVGLGAIAARVLAHDREALSTAYAHDQAVGIEAAARSIAADVADIGKDLELASSLYADAESPQIAERELHAVATIKREYVAMEATSGDHSTHVVAFDAPPGADAETRATLARVVALAEQHPGRLHAAAIPTSTGSMRWYRAFAKRANAHAATVGVVVDMAIVLERIRLEPDAVTQFSISGPDAITERVTPSSSPRLAEVAAQTPALRELVAAARTEHAATAILDRATTARLGLDDSDGAVAIAIGLAIDDGPPWSVLAVASTKSLAEQRAVLARRALVGGLVALVLFALVAGTLIRSARRTATLRERLAAADRMAHLTEKDEKIVEHIPSGVLTIAQDGRVTSANPWFAARVAASVVGKSLEDSLAPPDLALLQPLVERAKQTREAQSLPRTAFETLGDANAFSIRVIPLARGSSEVDLLVVFDDLSQLRRIEDRLLHSEKLITAGQLAAGIAHEIGTPLGVARARIELVQMHLGAAHADAANLGIAIEQIDRVTRLIENLLSYVRPMGATMRAVDAAALVGSVVELLRARAVKAGVELAVDLAADLPPLRADSDQLQQVMVNLVMNAVDACARGGHVRLTARRGAAGDVRLEVSDDGHGIAREHQAQVFDPFFTTKKRGQGTGLGLWVVAQLVRAHAAELELASELDVGTRVQLSWPTAQEVAS